jgi:hypothetical protein
MSPVVGSQRVDLCLLEDVRLSAQVSSAGDVSFWVKV